MITKLFRQICTRRRVCSCFISYIASIPIHWKCYKCYRWMQTTRFARRSCRKWNYQSRSRWSTGTYYNNSFIVNMLALEEPMQKYDPIATDRPHFVYLKSIRRATVTSNRHSRLLMIIRIVFSIGDEVFWHWFICGQHFFLNSLFAWK